MRLTLQMMIENGLLDELANRVARRSDANRLLTAIAFPSGIRPNFDKFDTSGEFWLEIGELIEDGRVNQRFEDLLAAAARQFPGNPVFAPFKKGVAVDGGELKTVPAFVAEHDAFISYSSQDAEIVQKLARELRSQGVNPWLDRWDLPSGQAFVEEIERVLSTVKVVIVCVGTGGYGPWQRAEVDIALDRAVRNFCTILPVMLPGVSPHNLPPFLRRINGERLTNEAEVAKVSVQLVMEIERAQLD